MERSLLPVIEKYINSENVLQCGAFSCDSVIKFKLTVPRRLGVSFPLLRIAEDGGADNDYCFGFIGTDWICDVFELDFRPSDLTDGRDGLLFYTYVFPKEDGAFYTEPYNNVDFELAESDNARFSLLLYRNDFKTPAWLGSGVMYHIFIDRFFRGDGAVRYREDTTLDTDWENGVPQYGERAGSFVENNVFFGGNLWGVAEKLPYLSSLGVSVIYLSPVFEAHSNHKYDTGDYMRIDEGFGGEAAFERLLEKAKEQGIKIILDGVFNHTGDDSRYFDRYNRYGGGAYTNPESPYRGWYKWKSYPDEYECWWGVRILPRLCHENPDCLEFFSGNDGVVSHYIKKGIDGWRLDVADELSDSFLDELRVAAKGVSEDAAIIGEVWENAAEKTAYGKRRRYLRGGQLDSVMNYPLRNGIIAFVRDGDSGFLYNELVRIYGSYPRCVCDCLMNIIGTHDTERILTVLGGAEDTGLPNAVLAGMKMKPDELNRAIKLLKIASAIQFTVYGIPSVYYGDEAGVEGYHDPFCRMPFPWGRENAELTEHYRKLGMLRHTNKAYDSGDFLVIGHENGFLAFERKKESWRAVTAANRGNETVLLSLKGKWCDALTGKLFYDEVSVQCNTVMILEEV